MKLLQFTRNDAADYSLGIPLEGGVLPVAAMLESLLATTDKLSSLGETLTALAQASELLDESELTLGPPLLNPGKILCVGLNYRQHALESGMAIPTTPVLFSKFNNSVAAPNAMIPLPNAATEYDYEVELAVVIGKRARNVREAEALDYVFGYTTANDLSARDLQMRTSQWLLGKTLDKFFPFGPYLVTADEVPDPQNLWLRTWLNGELRQDSNTSDMIFSVAEIIAYASRYMTLEPGDVISTGTPEGVIMGMAEKHWLKPGDVVSVEVEGLGRLTNTMTADAVDETNEAGA